MHSLVLILCSIVIFVSAQIISQALPLPVQKPEPLCQNPVEFIDAQGSQLRCGSELTQCSNLHSGDRISLHGNECVIVPQGMAAQQRLLLGLKIDLNQATEETLLLLDGIGPKTAAAIVAYRKSQGRFKTVSDLQNVKEIGPHTFEQLQTHFKVE